MKPDCKRCTLEGKTLVCEGTRFRWALEDLKEAILAFAGEKVQKQYDCPYFEEREMEPPEGEEKR